MGKKKKVIRKYEKIEYKRRKKSERLNNYVLLKAPFFLWACQRRKFVNIATLVSKHAMWSPDRTPSKIGPVLVLWIMNQNWNK